MAKFRKKPVEIEAFQFYVDSIPNWFMDKVSSNDIILRNCDYKRYSIEEAYCEIKTPEGEFDFYYYIGKPPAKDNPAFQGRHLL